MAGCSSTNNYPCNNCILCHSFPIIVHAGEINQFIHSTIFLIQMGTKIVTAFRYLSQSSILHLLVYFTVFFVYGIPLHLSFLSID